MALIELSVTLIKDYKAYDGRDGGDWCFGRWFGYFNFIERLHHRHDKEKVVESEQRIFFSSFALP